MYAIIETGGKQYIVHEGDTIRIEKLGYEPGAKVIFDKVLLLSTELEGIKIGDPSVKDASVEANVISEGKEKKVKIFKMKAKKGYRKSQGHRQPYTKVQIAKING
jgi:large subunit ribosomal protein L21